MKRAYDILDEVDGDEIEVRAVISILFPLNLETQLSLGYLSLLIKLIIGYLLLSYLVSDFLWSDPCMIQDIVLS